jgi:hypothetical protein
MALKSIRVPITNIYDGNDYSAKILIGSNQTPANVILDTGSSTLAVKPSLYSGKGDRNLQPTSLAQLIQYGTGGWAGPVVTTNISMGVAGDMVSLQAPIAIADMQQRGNFTGVDGILGLAYNALNDAYDFLAYFEKHNINPPTTYPWSFPSHSFKKFVVQFNRLVKSEHIPGKGIDSYFNALEEKGITPNKFAFYTLRSWIHMGGVSPEKDPWNNGFFVMGGGEEQTDLYTGSFVNVKVLDDLYYNTNLKAVQVEGANAVKARPLSAQYPFLKTNSIIDSGTSYLALASDVFDAIIQSLNAINPTYTQKIKQAGSTGISVADLDLPKWPNIKFILEGEGGKEVTLVVSPQTYWQVNYPSPGRAVFQMGGGEVQSILGLPLLNNYYTVFDRSADTKGIIKFAPIKSDIGHK